MTTWKLSPQYKKSAVEKMFFYKEGKTITIEQGYRWATFSIESDVCPMSTAELKNEDGYDLDGDWEMWDMIDGCWIDIEAGNEKTTDEDVEAFSELWNEDGFEGVESAGWSQDDCEYYYFGPLELTNEDTGEVFKGEPDSPAMQIDLEASTPLEEIEEAIEEDNPYTDWYPASINPVRNGTYQVLAEEEEVAWPFQSNIIAGTWDGEKWDVSGVVKWRGLSKEPK
jgi:hypothetical protein